MNMQLISGGWEIRFEPTTDQDRVLLNLLATAAKEQHDAYYERARASARRRQRFWNFLFPEPPFTELPPRLTIARFHDGSAIVTVVEKAEKPEWV